MPQNAANIRIAITGKVLTAPQGTAAPVDVTTAWGASWTDHGYTDQNGVKVTPKVTAYDVKAWQSDTAVRSRILERIRELQFVLLQTGGLNTRLYEGGGSWASISSYVSVGATTYTATTATDPGAAWAVNQYAGKTVTAGGSTGVVLSNTATVLTLTAAGWTGGLPAAATVFTILSGVSQFTPPVPGSDDTRMLGIEFVDGAITKRIIHPSAIVVAVAQVDYKSGVEARYDVTMRILGDTWYELSNDPADQAAALAA